MVKICGQSQCPMSTIHFTGTICFFLAFLHHPSCFSIFLSVRAVRGIRFTQWFHTSYIYLITCVWLLSRLFYLLAFIPSLFLLFLCGVWVQPLFLLLQYLHRHHRVPSHPSFSLLSYSLPSHFSSLALFPPAHSAFQPG